MAFELGKEVRSLSESQIKFLSDILEERGFKGSKVDMETLGNVGDNYASNVKRITAKNSDGRVLKMVAKIAPTAALLRPTVDTTFGNEFFIYEKVLPKFHQLEIEADIPEEDRLKFPICYGTLNENLHEIILLEDVKELDFIMLDRLKPLTNEEVRMILRTYAKLHALSFALKDKDPETYKDFATNLVDFFTTPAMEENAKTGFSDMEEMIVSALDTDWYKDRIKGNLVNVVQEAHKLKKCEAGSKHSVIVHGDSWINNIMFKVENDVPQDCMLIDYQLSAEKSPVNDLHYLIFSCTDYKNRSEHYNDWMDYYHEELDKRLFRFGIKASYVYPKEKMLADLKRNAKFFLAWSIILTNVLSLGADEAAKLKNVMDNSESVDDYKEVITIDNMQSDTQNLIRSRVQGILDSFYELGYIS